MFKVLLNSYKLATLTTSRATIRDNHYKIHGLMMYSTEETPTDQPPIEKKLGGFAKAFQKYTNLQDIEKPEEKHTFASLLRNSKFIDLGDPEGKIVTGEIFQVVDNDLYIDFGWKFHCVCSRPNKNGEEYTRGAKVRLMIKDLELSSRFLGSDTDLTLLEADCKILNIISSPARKSITRAA